MIEIVKVVEAKPLAAHRLWVKFTDGKEGVRDFADILAEGGPMVDWLRDEGNFAQVFVTFGVSSWPNAFDVDAVELHRELAERGALSRVAA